MWKSMKYCIMNRMHWKVIWTRPKYYICKRSEDEVYHKGHLMKHSEAVLKQQHHCSKFVCLLSQLLWIPMFSHLNISLIIGGWHKNFNVPVHKNWDIWYTNLNWDVFASTPFKRHAMEIHWLWPISSSTITNLGGFGVWKAEGLKLSFQLISCSHCWTLKALQRCHLRSVWWPISYRNHSKTHRIFFFFSLPLTGRGIRLWEYHHF